MGSSYDRLFGSHPDAIFVARRSTGEVVFQNPAAHTLVGSLWDQLPPRHRTEIEDDCDEGNPTYHASLDHPKHGKIGITLTYCGLPTADDDVVYFKGILQNDTATMTGSGHIDTFPKRIPEELHVFNARGLLNRVGDKIEIAEEVVRNIRESLPEHMGRCRTAFERENLTELRQVSHTVKGSAGTAGAEVVADRASQINKLLRRDITDQAVIESFLAELEAAVTQFLAIVSQDDLFNGR